MATTVRITETYDLKTTVNKIGLIGVHTPTTALLNRLYPGLVKNHEFVRFMKCDIAGACASVLPADPLSVGVSAGDVAPEDMFNPILYKAVTNSSFDTLVGRITMQSDLGSLGSVNAGTLSDGQNAFDGYYSLLAENGEYRKAMPQSGWKVKGLVPICHTLISTFGNVSRIGNFAGYEKIDDEGSIEHPIPALADTPYVSNTLERNGNTYDAVVFRGKSVKMPKIPLHYRDESYNAVSDVIPIPKTYVCAFIVPPARLHEFYYRMRVTWTIRFENVISTLRYSNFAGMRATSPFGYYSGISYSSSKADMENLENLVDTNEVEISKIMES